MKDIETFECNGFTYSKDYADSSTKVEIEHGKESPTHLFKFYGMSKYSVDALKNGYLYASHPLELNDILDSSYFLFNVSKPLDYSYYEKLFGPAYSDKLKLYEFYLQDIKNDCHSYIFELWQILTNKFGVVSMTSKEDNALMWPHYTMESGFQLKFDTSNLENSIKASLEDTEEYLGLFPINYTKILKPIDISQFRQMFIPLFYSTTIKSAQWEYEEEWRFLISKNNMGVPHSKSGLSHLSDYDTPVENRYAYYDNSLVEEITVGRNFFKPRHFEQKRIGTKTVHLRPKNESNWLYEDQKAFMEYVSENLSDKFYVSGVKYELDENGILYLIRTKERMNVEQIGGGLYELTRTDEVIKLL
ncbi:DUF2971 domain-containing protein [Flagellimonas sp.]|uniref:DUF2971 domain-containing protein n=1 Tax=Flagellimonas sp. TaxID=2058762 RepID=UPI003AB10CB7